MVRKQRFVVAIVAILALLAVPAMAQEARDQGPPVGPGTPGEATGGPDAFGYTWADTADGCTYDFVDISATGVFVVDGDENAAPVTLGGSFNFYGVDLTDMGMASNGYLSSDPAVPGGDLSNDCPLPAAPSTGGGARIYPLHDDLEFPVGSAGAGYYEYFDQCPRANPRCREIAEPCSVFMWDDVAHFLGTQTWDHEVILYHATGDMVFQIGPGNPETGSSSTTGIQNEAADDGLTYACNTAGSIPDNTAVCWTHPDDPPGICLSILAIPTASPTGLVMLTLFILMSGVAMLIVLRKRHAS